MIILVFLLSLFISDAYGQSLRLDWLDACQAPECIEDGFKPERCTGAGCVNFAPLNVDIPRDAQTWTDTTVELGKTYGYRLYSFIGEQKSEYSNSAYGTTSGLLVNTRPGLITSVSRRASNTSSVISVLVNRNETLGPQGVEIAYRSGVTLSISRRAADTSSVVSFLVNKDEIIKINGEVK